jgi:hypothetical protein
LLALTFAIGGGLSAMLATDIAGPLFESLPSCRASPAIFC